MPTAWLKSTQTRTIKRFSVAIVAPSLRHAGGQAVQADLLLQHFNNDPEFEAILIPAAPVLPKRLNCVEQIPFLRTLVRMPFYLYQLWRGVSRAEIIHIFSASYWSFLLCPVPAWLTARLQGKRSIIHYHSGEALDHLQRSPVARFVLRRVDQIVTPSQYLVDIFQRFNLAAIAIPNIVDSRFTYRCRNPLRPRLICTRMFEPYYQVDLVVRAFAVVVTEFPEATLCLVGTGSLEDKLKALVAELELYNVEFVGTAARDQIGSLYDRADIFVNASKLDNMPVSILEAFAVGTPVISTAPCGIRYMVEHERTGLLCECNDWHSLARNIIRLLNDSELSQRLVHNAHIESRRYRWEVVRRQWFDVYSTLNVGR
jgi:glycosyltransferase involved in cell wall biosynthesis